MQYFWTSLTILLLIVVHVKLAIYLRKKGLPQGVDCLVWTAIFMAAMLYRIYTIIEPVTRTLGR